MPRGTLSTVFRHRAAARERRAIDSNGASFSENEILLGSRRTLVCDAARFAAFPFGRRNKKSHIIPIEQADR